MADTARTLSEDFYDKIKPRLYEKIAEALGRTDRVVDLGCGGCGLVVFLAERCGCDVTGVDVSDASFPKKQKIKGRTRRKVKCIKADARELEFLEDESVGAVVSVWALHEMEHPLPVLREALRVLRPGGPIIIVDFPKNSLAQRLWNERYYTPGQIEAKLKRAGFVGVRTRLIERRQIIWATGRKRLARTIVRSRS